MLCGQGRQLALGGPKFGTGGGAGAGEGSGGESVPQETRLAGSPHRVIFQRGWEREGPGAPKGPSSQQGPGGSPPRWDLGGGSVPRHTGLWSCQVLRRALRPETPPASRFHGKGQPGSQCPGSLPAPASSRGEAVGTRRAPLSGPPWAPPPPSWGLGVTVGTWRGGGRDRQGRGPRDELGVGQPTCLPPPRPGAGRSGYR